MRIAILTQPLRYNYGGILQNFALQTVLKRMGHDVVTLDPPRYHCKWWWQYVILILRHAITRYVRGHRNVPIFSEWLQDKETKTLGTNTFKFVDLYIQRKEYKRISKEIKKNDYDAFIVGSDQTWRYRYNSGRILDMFLAFSKGWNVKRIAYAASFGTDEWECDEETTNICKNALSDFDIVTVREDFGIDICKRVFNVEAHHVLDPTMLLSKGDYIKLVEEAKVHKSSGNMFCYILDTSEKKESFLQRIASEKKLKPFYMNAIAENIFVSKSEYIQPPVECWIRGFMDAELVVTDSFHACVFSIIFGKPFVAIGNKERGLVRFQSLLNLFSLEDHLITDVDEYNQNASYAVSKEVLERMDLFRKMSISILSKEL